MNSSGSFLYKQQLFVFTKIQSQRRLVISNSYKLSRQSSCRQPTKYSVWPTRRRLAKIMSWLWDQQFQIEIMLVESQLQALLRSTQFLLSTCLRIHRFASSIAQRSSSSASGTPMTAYNTTIYEETLANVRGALTKLKVQVMVQASQPWLLNKDSIGRASRSLLAELDKIQAQRHNQFYNSRRRQVEVIKDISVVLNETKNRLYNCLRALGWQDFDQILDQVQNLFSLVQKIKFTKKAPFSNGLQVVNLLLPKQEPPPTIETEVKWFSYTPAPQPMERPCTAKSKAHRIETATTRPTSSLKYSTVTEKISNQLLKYQFVARKSNDRHLRQQSAQPALRKRGQAQASNPQVVRSAKVSKINMENELLSILPCNKQNRAYSILHENIPPSKKQMCPRAERQEGANLVPSNDSSLMISLKSITGPVNSPAGSREKRSFRYNSKALPTQKAGKNNNEKRVTQGPNKEQMEKQITLRKFKSHQRFVQIGSANPDGKNQYHRDYKQTRQNKIKAKTMLKSIETDSNDCDASYDEKLQAAPFVVFKLKESSQPFYRTMGVIDDSGLAQSENGKGGNSKKWRPKTNKDFIKHQQSSSMISSQGSETAIKVDNNHAIRFEDKNIIRQQLIKAVASKQLSLPGETENSVFFIEQNFLSHKANLRFQTYLKQLKEANQLNQKQPFAMDCKTSQLKNQRLGQIQRLYTFQMENNWIRQKFGGQEMLGQGTMQRMERQLL